MRRSGAAAWAPSAYTRVLRAALPERVFARAPARLAWMPLHGAIVVAGTAALGASVVPWPLVPAVSLAIGLAFAGLTFLAHETLHGSVVGGRLLSIVGWIAFLPFCLSPRLWIAWHNREHHGHTNQPDTDPDAFPTAAEYASGRRVRLIMSYFAIGRSRWVGVLSLLLGFSLHSTHVLASAGRKGTLSPAMHRRALGETALGVAVWATVAVLVGPLAFVFAYVLPLLVANAIVMAFIFTNHALSPLTAVNDPLLNGLSVTGPRWFEWLTMRFGYHVEHHLFPAMSPRGLPLVRTLVRVRWPERYQSMPFWRALARLHRTARIYKDDVTLFDPETGEEWPTLAPTGRARGT